MDISAATRAVAVVVVVVSCVISTGSMVLGGSSIFLR